MASFQEYLQDEGYEKLKEARKYVEELSLDDPDDEPYRSLYKGREIYKDVRRTLKRYQDKRQVGEEYPFILAVLELKLGENYVSTDEKSAGEEHLQKALEKMEDYKLTKKGMGIYQDAVNQMGILFTGRQKPEEALNYFRQSEQLYVDYKNLLGGAPCMVNEYLSPPTDDLDQLEFDRAKSLESTYTHTLFYFAQVYQQLGKADVSAQYIHHTLQRQLDSHDLDPLDWSLHAATLSQYYMTERNFNMSRHCLASAEVIFQQVEANNVNCPDEMKEKVNQAKADIQRCWVKYGLGLLEYSREKLLRGDSEITETETTDEVNTSTDNTTGSAQSERSVTPKSQSASDSHNQDNNLDESLSEENASIAAGDDKVNDPEDTETEKNDTDNQSVKGDKPSDSNEVNDQSDKVTENDREAGNVENEIQGNDNINKGDEVVAEDEDDEEKKKLEAEKQRNIERAKQINERFNLEVTHHEEKISDKHLANFEEARVIFLLIKKWIEDAKQFYKFDMHCTDYVSIVQDQSLSFKFLSFFELDLERQCKMHKRRVDMLTEILKELSLQHYLLICRQLMFEIADTYSTMMDLKLAILESSGEAVRPTPHHVKKMNILISESIKYYQEYLNTLKGGKPVYPNEFPENDVRPGLIAMFCIGRLFSKFLAGEVQTRLLNIKKSKDCYQFVVDYCKRNPSAVALIPSELEICQEMVQLLPAKMERIRIQSEM
ncbi:hypothetical protein ACF0H5_003525 [Mactra antiquata]